MSTGCLANLTEALIAAHGQAQGGPDPAPRLSTGLEGKPPLAFRQPQGASHVGGRNVRELFGEGLPWAFGVVTEIQVLSCSVVEL